MSRTPLLLRDPPHKDENLTEYLRRLLGINGYPGSFDFVKDILQKNPVTIEDLTDLTFISTKQLNCLPEPWPSWIKREGNTASPEKESWLNRIRMRWCPACLAEDHYMRSAWSLSIFVACPTHNTMLRESCDACGKVLTWRSGSHMQCTCGRRFTEMTMERAPETHTTLMQWYSGNGSRQLVSSEQRASRRLVTPFARLSQTQLLRLLHALAPHISARPTHRHGRTPGLQNLSTAANYVDQCAQLLLHWPYSFQTMMAKYDERTTTETSIRRKYSALYRLLYKTLAGNEFDFMRREFEAYLDGHWYGAIDGRHRAFSKRKWHTVLSAADIRRELGCSRGVIWRLISTGGLNARILRSPMGRRFAVADANSVAQTRAALRDVIDLHAASELLGISRRRIRILLSAGLIGEAPNYHRSKWSISVHEVRRLLDLPTCDRADHSPEETLLLRHVLRHMCRDNAVFVSVIESLLSGAVRTFGKASGVRGIGAYLVHKDDVRSVICDAKRLPPSTMSAQVVAQVLSIKEEVAYHLIRSGLLPHDVYRVNGRTIDLVTKDDVVKFRSTYVSLVDIAKRWNVSPKAALRRLSERGVDAITGPSVDRSRQYFYRVADVSAT
ncbi:hypothetical protein DIE15_15315 [Burkholderia sp. Bp9031]|nr:hypothetical protein DIE15_15315 [Burkholderia sp. Bp9031]